MKKFLGLIILTILFFSIHTTKLISNDCPQGYTPRTVMGYYNWDGNHPLCYYLIEYCCYWNNSTKKLSVMVLAIWNRSSCQVPQSEWSAFYDLVYLISQK